MVVREAHRRDRQLGHQPAVDVVISRQDQVQDVAADVSWNADVLSRGVVCGVSDQSCSEKSAKLTLAH